MDFWDVVERRHSVRDFTTEPVSRESIQRILEAAQMAPSAMNSQPWHFYVATGQARERLGKVVAQTTVHLTEYMDVLGPERYEEAVRWYSSLGDAPVVIVVGAARNEDDFGSLNGLLSMGASIAQLLLAATAAGLGACNVTFSFWVRDDIAEAVGMDADHEVVSVIAVGHPTDQPPVAPEHDLSHITYLD